MKTMVLVFGILLAIPAALLVLASLLGFAGILADVGPAENRKIALQSLIYAAPCVVLSLVSIAFAIFKK